MFIVTNGTLAIVLCIVTMLCWGSWGNTQKLAGKSWRYELFYWDYCVGILLFSVLLGLTLGSNGEQGQPFVQNLLQMDGWLVLCALAGGAIFNAANILLTAAVSISGLAIAWPIGLGIALYFYKKIDKKVRKRAKRYKKVINIWCVLELHACPNW